MAFFKFGSQFDGLFATIKIKKTEIWEWDI